MKTTTKILTISLFVLGGITNVQLSHAEEGGPHTMYAEYKYSSSQKYAAGMAVSTAKNKASKYCSKNGWSGKKNVRVISSSGTYVSKDKWVGKASISFYCYRH